LGLDLESLIFFIPQFKHKEFTPRIYFIFMEQSADEILRLVREYNILMKEAVTGPNCIDPQICHADCCHIMIDLPKILADYYLKNGYAKKQDFVRGDLFSFKIAVNSMNAKCAFYDKSLNGCRIHQTMHKPPQCWIYPTGFSPELGEDKKFAEDGSIQCKKVSGWKIIDRKKTNSAKELFDTYVEFCEKEFIIETSKENIKQRLEAVFTELENFAPKSVAGVIDGWDHFSILASEGISLKLKTICNDIPKESCACDYMECKKVCKQVIEKLRHNLLEEIMKYIESKAPKTSYSFLELWSKK
jgi:Fe-S-cluster containining protein